MCGITLIMLCQYDATVGLKISSCEHACNYLPIFNLFRFEQFCVVLNIRGQYLGLRKHSYFIFKKDFKFYEFHMTFCLSVSLPLFFFSTQR